MLRPPIQPMLATRADALPAGHLFEPKWDGFRAIVFRDDAGVEIGSRTSRTLTRYFPELVAAFADLPPGTVVDGEIVLPHGDGLDFELLGQRIHPAASRVAALAAEHPARFVGFDVLCTGGADRLDEPFARRRERLEQVLPTTDRMTRTPITDDIERARVWFDTWEAVGIDGIVAKHPDLRYQPGKRVMTKVKHHRTAEVVLGGFRTHASAADQVGSLLLGMVDEAGTLVRVGVAASFPEARRRALHAELAPLAVPLAEHPWAADPEPNRWNRDKDRSFTPLAPELVLEVAYDFPEKRRFRHTASFVRWRPDRDPASCLITQLDRVPGAGIAEVWDA